MKKRLFVNRPATESRRSLLVTTKTGSMADRDRRGMLIKNNGTDTVQVSMSSRSLRLDPGEEMLLTPDEVRDPTLRKALQERSIAIVRPATPKEDEQLQEQLDEQ